MIESEQLYSIHAGQKYTSASLGSQN